MAKKQNTGNGKLTNKFLSELFKLSFLKQNVLDVVTTHLQYSYIPVELSNYKKVLKGLTTSYKLNNQIPTIGVISQQFNNDQEVQDLLVEIKETSVVDVDSIFSQLEQYIKRMRFALLHDKIIDLYKEDKKDEAIALNATEGQEIANFSIRKESGNFLKLFADYEKEQHECRVNQENETHSDSIPFGIDPLDNLTDGGLDVGDIALFIARSGVGKSTWLRWMGLYTCRLGYRVLHIQLEGSRKEAFEKYTQIWTGLDHSSIKRGEVPKEKQKNIEKVLLDFRKHNKDVTIVSFERFGSASMLDIREVVLEYQKIEGVLPQLVLIDSLDLLTTGTNKKIDIDPTFKKDRLQTVAQMMKNLCNELKGIAIATATQTGDIAPLQYNNPDWVITRSNTEGDRTLVKPFSYVFTFNQTDDEYRQNLARIHCDKLRNYAGKHTFHICTHYSNGRFYDREKTMRKYYNHN